MYQVGQQILDGQLVVVAVDAQNLILSVSVPPDHDESGNPLTITYNAGVTEAFIAAALKSITG